MCYGEGLQNSFEKHCPIALTLLKIEPLTARYASSLPNVDE